MKSTIEEKRHSLAHLLAASVKTLWPNAKNAIGPAIENGFYQDFDMGNVKISEVDFEKIEKEVEKILDTIWFPNLLYKPIRSTYYTVKGNMAMMKQDFDTAEKHLKHSNDLGSAMPEAEGANKLQLGMMAMQKGDTKQGEAYIRADRKSVV